MRQIMQNSLTRKYSLPLERCRRHRDALSERRLGRNKAGPCRCRGGWVPSPWATLLQPISLNRLDLILRFPFDGILIFSAVTARLHTGFKGSPETTTAERCKPSFEVSSMPAVHFVQ